MALTQRQKDLIRDALNQRDAQSGLSPEVRIANIQELLLRSPADQKAAAIEAATWFKTRCQDIIAGADAQAAQTKTQLGAMVIELDEIIAVLSS